MLTAREGGRREGGEKRRKGGRREEEGGRERGEKSREEEGKEGWGEGAMKRVVVMTFSCSIYACNFRVWAQIGFTVTFYFTFT